MKNKLLWLTFAILSSGAAQAAVTDIAQVPVLNIKGSGAVKPNLVMLYDNSGSMDFDYLPDVVSRRNNTDSNTCRGKSTLVAAVANCEAGHPPFNSTDFNKQYYNPQVRYTPPLKADGTAYNPASYGVASPWNAVRKDPFRGAATVVTNLVTGFPDMTWCNVPTGSNPPAPTCKKNLVTYTYPDDTYYKESPVTGAPYYYTIKVGEYCQDVNLTKCQTVAVGAPAPTGYPFPAKVRWCTNKALDTATCQGKTDNTHFYPRFTRASTGTVSYGTLTIGESKLSDPLKVLTVYVNAPGNPIVISNAESLASMGTVTATNRAELTTRVASSINAKTGVNYIACVKTPTGAVSPAVAACSTYGITLPTNYVVAVIPVTCAGGQTPKTNCAKDADGSQAGWDVGATVSVTPPTAVLSVTGTTAASFSLANVSIGNTTLFASALTGTTAQTAAQVASGIIQKVNDNTGVSKVMAYAGGNSITPTCAAATGVGKICLVDTASAVDGASVSTGNVTNGGTLAFTKVGGAGSDTIPVEGVPLAAGDDIFVRTDIVPNQIYPKFPERADCAGTSCTYTEEMNNFAMWYAFYRTRDLMMKTAVGQAFGGVSDKFRVGLALLREVDAGGAAALAPNTFDITQRTKFYNALYASSPSGGTPMRNAVNKVGAMFKANLSWVSEYCQPNYMMVTTDGYWNGAAASGVTDNDAVDNPNQFCTKDMGCTDTTSPNTGSNSLADVALYWYKGGSNGDPVSMFPDATKLEDMSKPGLVPAKPGENTHLHINTFTLGLGMDGFLNYDPDYDNAKADPNGDFLKIKNGTTGCPWNNGGPYIWPDVLSSSTVDQQSRVDDLWHAAVNGRGKYFSASVPAEVVNGVQSALNNIASVMGAASSAATSTPNITMQDNDIFSDTFTTGSWYGEVSAEKIDPVNGNILPGTTWSTSDTLGKRVAATTDTRTIYMWDNSAGNKLKPFLFANLLDEEKVWFENRCLAMAQCIVQNAAERNLSNNGTNLVNWLRGQQKYADDIIFRAYASTGDTPPVPLVLGDIVSSKPAYLRDPRKQYKLTGYETFKAAQQGRTAMVYTAANDGMLHAFNAANGSEVWAYMPRITMSRLASQASIYYSVNHQFTTDGSPDVADVQIGGVWRTVLVAGLGGGGRGFYALDVTDPTAPKALWELCADSKICTENNPHIGLTFGNAQFGMWDGKWVVFLTSGYNNVAGTSGISTGDGKGHLYIVDVSNGKILKDISTGYGDTATPSGFAKITAISLSPSTDPKVTYVYGGDNDGKMFRFDLTVGNTVTVGLMADATSAQPITTRPDVSICVVSGKDKDGKAFTEGRRVVLYGTGRLLAEADSKTTGLQSIYLLTDKDGPRTTVDLHGVTMVKQVLTAVSNGNFTVTNKKVDLAVNDGWYIDLITSGERVNLDPRIVSGSASVVTNVPGKSTACSVGGSSNRFQVELCSGTVPTSDQIAGGLLSNNSAAVGFVVVNLTVGKRGIATLANGQKVPFEFPDLGKSVARKTAWRRVRN